MIECNPLVPKFRSLRLWATVASCLLSACFVQPATAGYGHVPPYFVENRGQFGANEILYAVKGQNLTGYFSANHLALRMGDSRFQLTFPGANPAPHLEGIHPLAARINYLLGDAGGWHAQQALWRLVEQSDLEIAVQGPEQSKRMRDLMQKYQDRPMDLADASLVALAEERRLQDIFTLDRADFQTYRIHRRQTFRLWPRSL